MFRKRLLSLVAALAMVGTLLVGAGSAALAAPITDESVMTSLYFPWVPNGETLAGAGPWSGAVTIQNIEDVSVEVGFSSMSATVIIPAHGVARLSAASLGIPSPGDQLVATARWNNADLPTQICRAGNTSGTQSKTGVVTPTRGAANGAEAITLPEGETFTGVTEVSYGDTTYTVGTDYKVVQVGANVFNIDWSPDGAEPPTGAAYTVTFTYSVTAATAADCSRAPHVAGVEKQAMPASVDNLQTTGSDTTVDGYSAVGADDLGNVVYLPIVQRNNDWESIIHVSNPTAQATTVTLDLTVATNLSTGGNVTQSWPLPANQTLTIDLASLVNTGWIGSARLTSSDVTIAALVDRVKPVTNMALINVAEPMSGATVHAPLIFRGYQNWKTGINLANVSNTANSVTITYYRPDGSELLTDTVQIPARGMTFVYLPDEATAGENFAGSASLTGQSPFLVTLDEVKYTTANEAMSYLTTDAGQVAHTGDQLALPLVQKGDPGNGLGDTSGINVFNPANALVRFTVNYYDTSGTQVLTQNVTLEPHQGQTLYTLDQSSLPVGFQGSAEIDVTGGDGGLTAVSNNVNYAVAGDGSSVFSLARFPAPLVP